MGTGNRHFLRQAYYSFSGPWDDRQQRIYLVAFLEETVEKTKAKYLNALIVLNPKGSKVSRFKLYL